MWWMWHCTIVTRANILYIISSEGLGNHSYSWNMKEDNLYHRGGQSVEKLKLITQKKNSHSLSLSQSSIMVFKI